MMLGMVVMVVMAVMVVMVVVMVNLRGCLCRHVEVDLVQHVKGCINGLFHWLVC